jgi:oxygen-independent coproporphyrinogen-3 oxidase
MISNKLLQKYNVPGPRYTSYPTVPYWDHVPPSELEWKRNVKASFNAVNLTEGISLYIHLPFCESLCTYCGCNTRITKNHSFETPYILAVLKEWNLYLNLFEETPRIKEIHLGGGTPTFFSASNLKELIARILASSNLCPDAEFSFEAHPNNTTEAHLTTLSNLGFRRLSLGIQDFDKVVQKAINRIQSFETVENVTNLARIHGFTSINFDLIYGLPFQTRKSMIETINKVCQLLPDRIAFYSYAHVPWLKPSQRKYTEQDLPMDVEKQALYEIGRKKFHENGYKEIGMDHFSLRSDGLYQAMKAGTLHRNFMGYTSASTNLLIGLGVSAISDSWNSFIQNVKQVENYYDLLNDGLFPFFKGHLLNTEDLIIRKHILNIMCKGQTSWKLLFGTSEFHREIMERLIELEADGLIRLSADKLNIRAKGKPFLRNVCKAFDARLWRSLPKSQVFSMSI